MHFHTLHSKFGQGHFEKKIMSQIYDLYASILNQCTYKSGGSIYILLSKNLVLKLPQPKMSLSLFNMQPIVLSFNGSNTHSRRRILKAFQELSCFTNDLMRKLRVSFDKRTAGNMARATVF